MKQLIFCCLGFLLLNVNMGFSQAKLRIQESVKYIKNDVYALVLDINIPRGWMLEAVPYGVFVEGVRDTFSLSIGINKPFDGRLVQRLKASRTPAAAGFYTGHVQFAQFIKAKIDERGLYVGGNIRYTLIRKADKTGPSEVQHNKPFRFRIAHKKGYPIVSVGHKCLTKELYVQD
ncbi:MAG: hypothetical protein GY810_06350 [Aureispira sp.]|nr:hypothetical protein [Aureispira sp.]